MAYFGYVKSLFCVSGRSLLTITAPCHPWRCSNLEHPVQVMATGTLGHFIYGQRSLLAITALLPTLAVSNLERPVRVVTITK